MKLWGIYRPPEETMGKLNNELNAFLEDNQEFADVINLCIYQGKQVVLPEELEEEPQVLYRKDHRGKKHEIRNDVSKRCRNGHSYRIYCLENQAAVSHIMPVRVLSYEAGRYMEQIKAVGRSREKTVHHSWSELSDGFTGEDRLCPVVTLVLYWSREPWDGARTLYDMLDLTEEEKRNLSPFLQDYRLNLFNMYELPENENCKGQLKYILRLLQLDQDKKAIYAEVSKNPEYKNLRLDTGDVLAALLGSEKIKKCVEEQRKRKGETFDMCKALDDLWKDAEHQGMERGMKRGIERGITQGIRIFILDNLEENVPRERILLKLQKRFELNEEAANQYYSEYAPEGKHESP